MTEAIVSGANLADQIQQMQDHPAATSVRIEGGGSIDKQVILRKHTVFDSSVYSCDYQGITDQGQFLIEDGVRVEGTWRPPPQLDAYFKHGQGWNPDDPYLLAVQSLTTEQLAGTGTTILEPTFSDTNPALIVFQATGDTTGSHTDKTANIAVIGFHIKGRQQKYDGGVRSTIGFGNCTRGLAMYNFLEDTASIGITFGGSALEKNNYANDVVATRNCFSGVAAANTATINTENAYIFENYYRRPGHRNPRFGGGVSCHDHETNTDADHTKDIWLYNNLADYEDAAFDGVGTAYLIQDPYFSASEGNHRGAVYIVNNIAIGGRGAGSDPQRRYMTNGIFLNGLTGAQVVNNYIFRTGQNAIQGYGIRGCLIQDNDFESTGGGGEYTVRCTGIKDTVFRRNHYRDREGLNINTQAGFLEICGENNIYENNLTRGLDLPNVLRLPC